MNLFIDINADEKTAAAVTSLTDRTTDESLEQLILGDSVPLTIKFTDAGVAPAWAGADGYTLKVGLGELETDGLSAYTSSAAFTPITGGWSGRLSLATQALIDAVKFQVGQSLNNFRQYSTGRPSPTRAGCWFWLQIEVTDPSGNTVTYANLRVGLLNRVLPSAVSTQTSADDLFYAWIRANAVLNASLTGIASNVESSSKLCGLATANAAIPVGAKILVSFGSDVQALFEFVATTASVIGFLFAPWDYNATSNPYKWKLRAVHYLGVPCLYNADTALWHFVVAAGAANAVTLAPDQTGFALPA